MKRFVSLLAILAAGLFVAPTVHAQTAEVMQGTQVRLTLLNGLSTSVARPGDPFTAVVSEPVFFNNQMVLPAGAKVHGMVTNVDPPKRFALIRGGASMTLNFKSIEIASRIFPVRMSLLGIYRDAAEGGKARKDLSEVEGVAVEQKRDIKGYVKDAAIGGGGGSLVGLVFSNVARGFGIGMIGSAAYITLKRGKDVVLPAQTGMLVRLDNSVWVPTMQPGATSSGGGAR